MGSRLDRVTDWTERAREAGYRVSALAAGLGVTSRHLRRHIQLIFGAAPKVVLRRFRMDAALELLDSEHSIKEISFELGFPHATHFSRAFKREYGGSPARHIAHRDAPIPQNVRSGYVMSDLGLSFRLSKERNAPSSFPSAKERSQNISL